MREKNKSWNTVKKKLPSGHYHFSKCWNSQTLMVYLSSFFPTKISLLAWNQIGEIKGDHPLLLSVCMCGCLYTWREFRKSAIKDRPMALLFRLSVVGLRGESCQSSKTYTRAQHHLDKDDPSALISVQTLHQLAMAHLSPCSSCLYWISPHKTQEFKSEKKGSLLWAQNFPYFKLLLMGCQSPRFHAPV